MSELTGMTAAQLAGLIAAGDTSAVEVTRAHLDRITGAVQSGPAPSRASPTAFSACSAVVSISGTDVQAGVTNSPISVQPRITASAPRAASASMIDR